VGFVSRGGEKLDFALKHFKIDVRGKVCADFGSSTGGFVDCLLQNGAEKVFSVDTCYGELDWKLRNDPRVVVMERTNALYVQLPEKIDLVTIDVGWTKQEQIIPKALDVAKKSGDIITLLKPQYEMDAKWDGKEILLKQSKTILENVRSKIERMGVKTIGIATSPIKGKRKGNTEYFLWIKKE
jgi:23S rRNA (cytidine1920-2'-O)/16S rRNA (cytidine1409-2'-O)-methyltransferase